VTAWIPAGGVLAEVVRLAAGILLLVASWAGWGYWAGLLTMRGHEEKPVRFFDHAVAGAAALFVLATVLNQFTALEPWAGDASTAAGLAGCALLFKRRRAAGEPTGLPALTGLLGALYLAAGTRCISLHYDSGLYHLPFIEWLHAGALPLGLANLHVRFGYFSSWLVLGGLEGSSRFPPDLLYSMNAAAAVVVLGALLETATPALRSGQWRFSSLFSVASVVLLGAAADPLFFTWMGASPSPDVPAALLALLAFARLSEFLERGRGAGEGLLSTGLLAAAMAVTVKPSQAPVLAAAAGTALWARARLRPWGEGGLLRQAGAAAVLLAIWEAGGLIVSGCLLFPVAGSCPAAVPWSIDPAQAAAEAGRVAAWARAPGPMFREVQQGWQWLPYWRELMWPNRPVLLHVLVAGGGMLLVAALFRSMAGKGRMEPGERRAFAVVMATSLITVAATALTAPDPRFCLAFLIALPSAGTAWMLAGPAHRSRHRRAVAGAALALLAAVALVNLWMTPRCGECCAWRRLPSPSTEVRTTRTGLAIQVPRGTDQCWLTPPPCSPDFRPSVSEAEYFGRRAFVAARPAR